MTWCKCPRCRSAGGLEGRLFNPGTRDWDWHIFECPDCAGVGWRNPAVESAAGRVYVSVGGVRDERPHGSPRPSPETAPCAC